MKFYHNSFVTIGFLSFCYRLFFHKTQFENFAFHFSTTFITISSGCSFSVILLQWVFSAPLENFGSWLFPRSRTQQVTFHKLNKNNVKYVQNAFVSSFPVENCTVPILSVLQLTGSG